MVVADSIVESDAVVMVGAITTVAGLVAVRHTLAAKRMVGLMFHLSVACAMGKHIRSVNAQFAVIIGDAAASISRTVFVLPPAAHHLSGELISPGKVLGDEVDSHAPYMVFRWSRRHHLCLCQHGGGHLLQPLHHLVGTQRGGLTVDDKCHGLTGEHDGAVHLAHARNAGQCIVGIIGRIDL